MKQLTIFTPTYNRAYTLPLVYKGLLRQNPDSFIWMIYDDGSTDNTKSLVENWIEESKLEIKYVYAENSGKMRAINKGVLLCTTELFMCLDSDDYPTENAISKILKCWNENKYKRNDLAGVIAPRKSYDGKGKLVRGAHIPKNIKYGSVWYLHKLGLNSETNNAYRTDILRQFPIPTFEGENFISECSCTDQIDQHYVMVTLDFFTAEGNYLVDGYSNDVTKFIKNPKGAAFIMKQQFELGTYFRSRFRILANYICYSLIAGYSFKNIICGIKSPLLCLLIFPIGYLLKVLRTKKL